MKNRTRRQALALLGSTALTACSTAPIVANLDRNDPFEGGIGGTGVVGVLTGRGSLLVNGLRVELTNRTRVRSTFGREDMASLHPGMLLTIAARRTRDALIAENVGIDHVLIGTVRREGQDLRVNSVPVVMEDGARGQLVPGTRVAIGGVWTPHGVSASRIAPAPDTLDLIAGTVDVRNGQLAIGPAEISHRGGAPKRGEYAVALGRAEPGGFLTHSIRTGRFERGAALRQLSVDGYLEPIAAAPGFRIAGLGHSFARDLRLAEIQTRRAVYFGRYDGLFGASAGYIVPGDFEARQAVLNAGIDAGFDGTTLRLE